ncbi:hypothetical protein R3P38DRAFT_3344235 [Favolaschia claudopus]|uniref:Uncharacterized protein n=1 Tax=Favolaschia claudopus TaxID=2862362 RepID=A0AAW0DLU0_9AGAR
MFSLPRRCCSRPQGFKAPQHVKTAAFGTSSSLKTLQTLKFPQVQDLSGRPVKAIQGRKPPFEILCVKASTLRSQVVLQYSCLQDSNSKTSSRVSKPAHRHFFNFNASSRVSSFQDSARQSFDFIDKTSSNRAAKLARQALNLKASSRVSSFDASKVSGCASSFKT